MDKEKQKQYAALVLEVGIHLKQEQVLVISSPIECAEFTRAVAATAYELGAAEVVINWQDEQFSVLRLEHTGLDRLSQFPRWQRNYYQEYLRQDAAFLSIYAEDPELFRHIDSERILTAVKAKNKALRVYRQKLMSNENVWCVISYPTQAWANKVFPALSAPEAYQALESAMVQVLRLDNPQPLAAWREHFRVLKKHLHLMNENHFAKLHFSNSLGTDLTVELPERHRWLGGPELSSSQWEFTANLPTEEIYTVPRKRGVNGRVVASKPLAYNGNLIQDFHFDFKQGKVCAWDAKENSEVLAGLLRTDIGASFLGEVALVPHNSPISNSGILFYNTLFDENASCHLALGKGYPVCMEPCENKNKKEALREVNHSLVHEDFMFGSADLQVQGYRHDGTEMTIMRQGNFVI